jgi:amino acid transporter
MRERVTKTRNSNMVHGLPGDMAPMQIAATSETTHAHNKFRKSVTLLDAVCVLAGSIIGTGIFASPGVVVTHAGSVHAALLVWLMAGILVLLVAMVYVELGTSLPSCGGEVTYFETAYGRSVSFAYLISSAGTTRPASASIISLVAARYTIRALETLAGTHFGERVVTATSVIFLLSATYVNARGGKAPMLVQRIITVGKLLLVATICALSWRFMATDPRVWEANININHTPMTTASVVSAMFAALFAFGGYTHANYVSEEMENPGKDLPIAVGASIALVALVYVVINVAFMGVLSLDQVITSKAVAIDMAEAATSSPFISAIIGLGIAGSALGSLNVSIMVTSRMILKGGQTGLLPGKFGELSRDGAPRNAAAVAAVVPTLMLCFAGFDKLIHYFGLLNWLGTFLCSVALIKIRMDHPDLPRPFKVPMYPLLPLATAAMSGGLVIAAIMDDAAASLCVIGFAALPTLMRAGGRVDDDADHDAAE